RFVIVIESTTPPSTVQVAVAWTPPAGGAVMVTVGGGLVGRAACVNRDLVETRDHGSVHDRIAALSVIRGCYSDRDGLLGVPSATSGQRDGDNEANVVSGDIKVSLAHRRLLCLRGDDFDRGFRTQDAVTHGVPSNEQGTQV